MQSNVDISVLWSSSSSTPIVWRGQEVAGRRPTPESGTRGGEPAYASLLLCSQRVFLSRKFDGFYSFRISVHNEVRSQNSRSFLPPRHVESPMLHKFEVSATISLKLGTFRSSEGSLKEMFQHFCWFAHGFFVQCCDEHMYAAYRKAWHLQLSKRKASVRSLPGIFKRSELFDCL